MENQPLIDGLQWLGGGAVVLSSVVGIGSIILALMRRYWGRKDIRETRDGDILGKKIDLDGAAFKIFSERLDKLTDRFDKLQQEHSSLMATNAGLEKENEYLRRENVRQEAEIGTLKDQRREQQAQILSLEAQVRELTIQVQQLTRP